MIGGDITWMLELPTMPCCFQEENDRIENGFFFFNDILLDTSEF